MDTASLLSVHETHQALPSGGIALVRVPVALARDAESAVWPSSGSVVPRCAALAGITLVPNITIKLWLQTLVLLFRSEYDTILLFRKFKERDDVVDCKC